MLSASHRCGEPFDAGCVERKNGMTCAIERHIPIVEHDPGVVDAGGDKVRIRATFQVAHDDEPQLAVGHAGFAQHHVFGSENRLVKVATSSVAAFGADCANARSSNTKLNKANSTARPCRT